MTQLVLPATGVTAADSSIVIGGTAIAPTVAVGTVPTARLADPGAGKVVGSSSAAAAAVFPPGYELNTTQITSSVNIASSTEATGTAVLSPGAITFDGAPVLVQFSGLILCDNGAAADLVVVSLFEGATQITRLAVVRTVVAASPNLLTAKGEYRFTPSAGAHTYTLTAHCTAVSGTPQVVAAAGGTGGNAPAFVRVTKV